VQQAFERVQKEDPTSTSLIISHRLSTIRSCDQICLLGKGRIVESGTDIELMRQRGTYYRLAFQNSLEQQEIDLLKK
jgi:ABC-type multidrug transport system fused ATPase/permease subunit